MQLTGYYGGYVNDLEPIRKALADGYVVLVGGDLVKNGGPSTAGHYLVIKKMNPDGSFVMADPWQPEFANRTISQEEFRPFIHGGDDRSFAISRAP